MVQRARKEQLPIDQPLHEIVIEGEWAVTNSENPEPFLIGDNRGNNGRVIVFASPGCLRLLSRSQEWFMDGNFSIAPPQFLQLYIIRVGLGGTFITACYALMSRKTERAYRDLFDIINRRCAQNGLPPPAPQAMHCDFEIAAHNAARHTYPTASIRACFYHLTQVSAVYN